MTAIHLSLIVSGVSVMGSIVSVIHSAVKGKKQEKAYESSRAELDKITKTLGSTIDKLKDTDISVELAQETVDKIIYDKLSEIVERETASARSVAVREAKLTFQEEIRREINDQYNDTKRLVKDALTKQAGDIDISGLKRDVVRTVEKTLMDKLDSEVDDAVDDFKDKLDKLYSKAEDEVEEHLDDLDEDISKEMEKMVDKASKEVENRLKLLEAINDRLSMSRGNS